MKTAKVILLAVVGLLLLADICWRVWVWHNFANYRTLANKFKLELLNTNSISGIEIEDVKTGQPIWIQWNDKNGEANAISYFLQGENILNLDLKEGKPPAYDVIFHGAGKSEVWWWDLRRGTFMTRTFYDTNGDFSKQEICYDNTWHTVERQNGTNGIVINGQWHGIGFDTNGMWTIETTTNR